MYSFVVSTYGRYHFRSIQSFPDLLELKINDGRDENETMIKMTMTMLGAGAIHRCSQLPGRHLLHQGRDGYNPLCGSYGRQKSCGRSIILHACCRSRHRVIRPSVSWGLVWKVVILIMGLLFIVTICDHRDPWEKQLGVCVCYIFEQRSQIFILCLAVSPSHSHPWLRSCHICINHSLIIIIITWLLY